MAVMENVVNAVKAHPGVVIGGTAALVILMMLRGGSSTTAAPSGTGVVALTTDPNVVAANTQMTLASDALSANGASLAAQVSMNQTNATAALGLAAIQAGTQNNYIAASQNVANDSTAATVTQSNDAMAVALNQTNVAGAVAQSQTAAQVQIANANAAVTQNQGLSATLMNYLGQVGSFGNGTDKSTAAAQVLAFLGQSNGVNVQEPSSAQVSASNLMSQLGSGAISNDSFQSSMAALQGYGL